MGFDIQVFPQGSRGLKQVSEAELLESPAVGEDGAAFPLLSSVSALMVLPQPHLSDTMGNFPKLEPQLPSFLHRPLVISHL